MSGSILAVCTSAEKRTVKRAVPEARLMRGHGISGDAHAGNWHRQLSLLDEASIARMREKGLMLEAGAFGENLVVAGLDLASLPIGRRLRVGAEAVVQLTQRGKTCHTRCAIWERTGECIMPTEGLFARVVRSGVVRPGDAIAPDPSFDTYRVGVVTLSDRRSMGEGRDEAGPVIVALLSAALPMTLVAQELLPDDRQALAALLVRLCDEDVCDLVVTTGGTGLSPRDVTPEATLDVVDRQVPGMAEAVRAAGLVHTPHAMLSRAVCGLRGQSLVVNLSGSPRAVREQLAVLLPALPHALASATGIPQECARPA